MYSFRLSQAVRVLPLPANGSSTTGRGAAPGPGCTPAAAPACCTGARDTSWSARNQLGLVGTATGREEIREAIGPAAADETSPRRRTCRTQARVRAQQADRAGHVLQVAEQLPVTEHDHDADRVALVLWLGVRLSRHHQQLAAEGGQAVGADHHAAAPPPRAAAQAAAPGCATRHELAPAATAGHARRQARTPAGGSYIPRATCGLRLTG